MRGKLRVLILRRRIPTDRSTFLYQCKKGKRKEFLVSKFCFTYLRAFVQGSRITRIDLRGIEVSRKGNVLATTPRVYVRLAIERTEWSTFLLCYSRGAGGGARWRASPPVQK